MTLEKAIVIAALLTLSLVSIPYIMPKITAYSLSSSGNPVISLTAPSSYTIGQPIIFTGWANVSSIEPQADTISILEYSYRGINNITIATNTGQRNVQFSFNYTLNFCFQAEVGIFAEDTLGNWNSLFYPQPCAIVMSFNSTGVKQISFAGGPTAVNSTFTNDDDESLTTIVVANVLNSAGAVIEESTATVIAPLGATVSGYPIIQGLPHGTYGVQVTIYSTSFVTLSPTEKLNVTI